MRFGSLFSGIAGLDLGLERAGMEVAWQSETDPYCCRVLAKRYPGVPNLGDVKHIDWGAVEPVDLVCGGYPCQPFSLAGVRRGESDERHLWPYFADALRVLRPEWALLENVPGHLSLGFSQVQADLAVLGYDTEWESLPAAAFGAPHLRWRIFLVAHAQRGELREQPVGLGGGGGAPIPGDDGEAWPVADADHAGREQQRGPGAVFPEHCTPQCSGWWEPEPDVGRVADGVPRRVDRLRGLGNAVVPQVAEWVGRQILAAGR